MSVKSDPEWGDLMQAWQSEAPEEAAPAPLSDEVRRRIRQKVRQHSYRMILMTISELILSVGMMTWLLSVIDLRQPVDLVALIGVTLLIATAWTFGLWNRRGTWWPAAESTRTFVDLSLERCRRKLSALRFAYGFLTVELLFLIPWATWTLLSREDPWQLKPWVFTFGWATLLTTAMLIWLAWYKKKTLRELAGWEELRKSLG